MVARAIRSIIHGSPVRFAPIKLALSAPQTDLLFPEDHHDETRHAQKENQRPKHCRFGIWNIGILGSQRLHILPVVPGGQYQGNQPYADQRQPKLPRPDPMPWCEVAIALKLKEFVNRETEGYELRRCPDPRHHRTIVSRASPLDRQPCRGVEFWRVL